MASKLFNIRLDGKRYDKLKIEVSISKGNASPLTMTEIIKEALDLRWERMDKHGKGRGK